MCLFQQLWVILFKPYQLVQRVEAERADAGNFLQLLRRHVAVDILHYCRGAWAFPADYRIQLLAVLINQCAVYAKGGDGDPTDLAGGQLRGEPLAAIGKALHNSVEGPLMPGAIFCRDVTGVWGGRTSDNLSLAVNSDSPHVGRATVKDQDNLLFHNCSWEITYCRMAASPYPAYKTVRFVGLIRCVSVAIRQSLDV